MVFCQVSNFISFLSGICFLCSV